MRAAHPSVAFPEGRYGSDWTKEEESGGVGIATAPSSICVTFSIVGLIVGSSWRHHNATTTYLSTLFKSKIASSSPSTRKSTLPHL
ncbi:unnamed protein product [Urochloa decumbens]|uniref:Uncharacterized protein n=1 Tax=Urochloa decumbens TaxID=240449 RepID=A0ABC9DBC1_9POAL